MLRLFRYYWYYPYLKHFTRLLDVKIFVPLRITYGNDWRSWAEPRNRLVWKELWERWSQTPRKISKSFFISNYIGHIVEVFSIFCIYFVFYYCQKSSIQLASCIKTIINDHHYAWRWWRTTRPAGGYYGFIKQWNS